MWSYYIIITTLCLCHEYLQICMQRLFIIGESNSGTTTMFFFNASLGHSWPYYTFIHTFTLRHDMCCMAVFTGLLFWYQTICNKLLGALFCQKSCFTIICPNNVYQLMSRTIICQSYSNTSQILLPYKAWGITTNWTLWNHWWYITDMLKCHSMGVWSMDYNTLRFMFQNI